MQCKVLKKLQCFIGNVQLLEPPGFTWSINTPECASLALLPRADYCSLSYCFPVSCLHLALRSTHTRMLQCMRRGQRTHR